MRTIFAVLLMLLGCDRSDLSPRRERATPAQGASIERFGFEESSSDKSSQNKTQRSKTKPREIPFDNERTRSYANEGGLGDWW
jgi:hypothetical protein